VAKRVSLKGKGADLFFGDYAPDQPLAGPTAADAPSSFDAASAEVSPDGALTETASLAPAPTDATVTPVPPARKRSARSTVSPSLAMSLDGELASVLASIQYDDVELIRKVVKSPGREVSFVRLSPEEKGELADLVHAYKRQGVKTTETEINRIAINFLLADHRANGEGSVLAKVLAALRA